MATETQLLDLIGRALKDASFMTRLKSDPVSAAKTLGISLSSSEAQMIRGLDVTQMTSAINLRSFDKLMIKK
jgi:hypothetical protein